MFDKINREKSQYESKIKLGIFITLSAFVLFIPLTISMGFIGFIITAFPFLGGAIIAGRNSIKLKALSSNFKMEYVSEELKKVIPDSQYLAFSGFTEREVIDSKLLFNHDEFSSEDMIEGTFENVKFRTSDVVQKDVVHTKNSTSTVTVFQGRFYEFDFAKPFYYNLLVLQPMQYRLFGEYEHVKLESIEFNSNLKVYAKSELEAFYLLTPQFMEKLVYLDRKYKSKITFSFLDKKLYIAIDSRKDYFDLKAFKPVDQSLIDSYKEEFETIVLFIRELQLNERLFREI